MKVALAQINPLVGDLDGNAALVVADSRRGAAAGAELVVFPELSLLGYPPLDLLDEPEFVESALAARDRLVASLGAAVPGVSVIFGAVGRGVGRGGKALENVAVLARDGAEIAVRPKSLLPSYDVFDEDRWFTPGKDADPVPHEGERLGLSVCEDIWNDETYWKSRRYDRDPVAELAASGATAIVNVSASPYHQGKPASREDMLRATARRHARPVVYVNQVGANDELIFDGGSMALDAEGRVLARARSFESDLRVVDLDAPPAGDVEPLPAGGPAELRRALVLGIADYVRKCRFPGALVGLSGGIDSAVVAALAAEALGPDRVEGVLMPSRFTSDSSNRDALDLAARLGIATRTIPIEPAHAAFLGSLAPHFAARPPGLAEQNLQARIRGSILMALSNANGPLVLATGNKSELAMGYCTLYGDMVGAIAVLGDCYKRDVRALARDFNAESEIVPVAIIDKAPSAELRADQRDEDELPPYAMLDGILEGLIERRLSVEAVAAEGFDLAMVRDVRRRLDLAEYKRRQAAPILRVSSRAFGPGRRLPIARGTPPVSP